MVTLLAGKEGYAVFLTDLLQGTFSGDTEPGLVRTMQRLQTDEIERLNLAWNLRVPYEFVVGVLDFDLFGLVEGRERYLQRFLSFYEALAKVEPGARKLPACPILGCWRVRRALRAVSLPYRSVQFDQVPTSDGLAYRSLAERLCTRWGSDSGKCSLHRSLFTEAGLSGSAPANRSLVLEARAWSPWYRIARCGDGEQRSHIAIRSFPLEARWAVLLPRSGASSALSGSVQRSAYKDAERSLAASLAARLARVRTPFPVDDRWHRRIDALAAVFGDALGAPVDG